MKPKIIPAFLNSLTYNERKYLLHYCLAVMLMGIYITYAVVIILPDIFTNLFNITNLHFIIYCIILGLFIIECVKYSNYKKLIKLEPKVKQQKTEGVK